MDNPIVISVLLSLIAGLFTYAIFVPRSTESFAPNNKEEQSKNKLLKLVTYVGGELHSTLPASMLDRNSRPGYNRVQSLLTKSGNPWKLTPNEFVFFQYITGFLGAIISVVLWFVLATVITIPWFIFIPFGVIFGFFIPRIKYSSYAKERDLEFKRSLPDALDLLIISLSGGNTFNQALRESIPNMKPGVLKEEFRDISRSLDAGKGMSEALNDFANRAPNENITTFIRAVQEANELNVPMIEILQSRADASRQDFFAVIRSKTASLEHKMVIVLIPTLLPALVLVVGTPAVYSLISSFGA